MDEAADLLGRDLEDRLLERIVAKYLYYRRGHEFVVVGGCDARHLPNDWPANMDTKVCQRGEGWGMGWAWEGGLFLSPCRPTFDSRRFVDASQRRAAE
jgi:hypothetical protein